MKKINLKTKGCLTRKELRNISGGIDDGGSEEVIDGGDQGAYSCPNATPVYRCFKLSTGKWYCYCGYN